MDLLCIEINSEPKAISDPVFLDDDRILKNMMYTEERYIISSSYFKCLQTDLKPYMRKVVAGWMLEVCEEECCQNEVFPMAINILDRFLSIVKIGKSQLQLVCCVCLFLASKLIQSEPLSADRLILYTDKSVTIEELMCWELLLLNKLKWDLAAVTPNDFLNIILKKLKESSKLFGIEKLIRKHSQTFIALCASELQFSYYTPSLIATASIATAVRGLQFRNNHKQSFDTFLISLANIMGIDTSRINECVHQIESLITSNTTLMHTFVTQNSVYTPNSFTYLEENQTNKYSEIIFRTDFNFIELNNN